MTSIGAGMGNGHLAVTYTNFIHVKYGFFDFDSFEKPGSNRARIA